MISFPGESVLCTQLQNHHFFLPPLPFFFFFLGLSFSFLFPSSSLFLPLLYPFSLLHICSFFHSGFCYVAQAVPKLAIFPFSLWGSWDVVDGPLYPSLPAVPQLTFYFFKRFFLSSCCFVHMHVLPACMYYTMCVSGAHGGQKRV